MLPGPKRSSHCQNWQEGEGARMTGSARSTSGIAALGHRSMNGDLFVLTVLRHGSRSLLLDRKSTRLNSSHLGISYAVFCLKKKTHKYQKAAAVPSTA